MPRDDDKSLGDEATLQGGKETPADERSLGDRSTFGGGDGSSLSGLGEFADSPDHDMEIVDLSSRYKIETTLGKGGMGEVLLATDTRLDRKVAIKRIRGDAGSSKAAVARFLTEAKSVAALNHHNIVQIHDYGRDENGPFLIMEYVPGGSLLDRCKQGPIELEEAIDLACQVCDGLIRAHKAGIIHRDIKPANILLTADNVPKLTDFGLAKAESRDHTMTMAGAVLGTLDFMPPEQRRDAALTDHRSDLWSLAATLYQMVTGKSPKIIRFDSLPPSLTAVLGQALEENKDARYQAASELKEALQQSLHGGNVASVELEQGVCPSCGTRNEASRKFCRNTSCAASLQVKCLSCSATIPVWEGVCGECGSIQTDLLEQSREEMAAQRAEAETCLASHDYKRATELAIEIGNEADPRLQQLKSWSEEFPEQVETIRLADLLEQRREEMAAQKVEAEAYLAVHDYKRAVELATEIGNEADPRLQQLKSWSNEFPEQVETIRLADAGKVQLASDEALSHERVHNYSSGIKTLKQIPTALLAALDVPEAESARVILARLTYKHNRTTTLEAEIKTRNKAGNLAGLLGQVQALLQLLPNRADLLELQKQLQERESDLEKARIETIAAAKEAMQQHDYNRVISVLAELKEEQVNHEASELISLAKTRKTQAAKANEELRREVNGLIDIGNFVGAFALVEKEKNNNQHFDTADIDTLLQAIAQGQAEHARVLENAGKLFRDERYDECRSSLRGHDKDLSSDQLAKLYISCYLKESEALQEPETQEAYSDAISILKSIPSSLYRLNLGELSSGTVDVYLDDSITTIFQVISSLEEQQDTLQFIARHPKTMKLRAKVIDALSNKNSHSNTATYDLICRYGDEMKKLGLRDRSVERRYHLSSIKAPNEPTVTDTDEMRAVGIVGSLVLILFVIVALCSGLAS